MEKINFDLTNYCVSTKVSEVVADSFIEVGQNGDDFVKKD
jgi:hypothetical protein